MEYREFLAGLDPTILGIDSGSFSLNRDVYWSESKNPKRVLSSKYVLTAVAEDYFDVQATFSAAVQSSEDDGPVVQALKIECVFLGHFHADGPVDREHAQRFADTEAWLIFWPFFRQFVVDTTARMAIPPIVVPLALRSGEYSFRPAKKQKIAHTKPAKASRSRPKASSKK